MAHVLTLELDDDLAARLQHRAHRHGHALEAEAREILSLAAGNEVERTNPSALGSRIAARFAGLGLAEEVSELCGRTRSAGEAVATQAIRDYLDEKISLGKAAELLQISRFELEDSFRHLGIPLRRGPGSIEDAQAEIAAARRHL